MAWKWVDNLLSPDHKKKSYWDARCPYMICPSNYPEKNKARLKFVQKISPFVVQYRCHDCGQLVNISLEQPADGQTVWNHNPALHSGKADYKFHV